MTGISQYFFRTRMNSQSSTTNDSMLARGNPSFKNPTIELIDRSGGILLTLTD
jgi:hypothetical protein